MPKHLEAQARQSVFIVREAPTLRKLQPPEGWPTETVTTDEELLAAIRRAHHANQRFLVLAGETDYDHTLKVLKQRAGGETLARGGIVVVPREPETFLRSH